MSLLKSFNYRKEAWAIQKLFMKRKGIEKMDKCLRCLKQWVLICPPKKKKDEYESPCSLKSVSKFQQERYVSRSIVELD